MWHDGIMTDSTRDPAALRFVRRSADQNSVVNIKITTVRTKKDKKLTGQAGAFAALERLYAENSVALRRLANG